MPAPLRTHDATGYEVAMGCVEHCVRGAVPFGLIVLTIAAIGPVALAQPPLEDGDYVLEVVDLPVLGDARGVGLGGAYGAVGEGAGALPWNPAAAASRRRWETDWFEFDLSLGAIFPSWADSSRLFGRTTAADVPIENFSLIDVGMRFQFGPVAFGALLRIRDFGIEGSGQSIESLTGHVDLAWALLSGDLVLGLGVHIVSLGIDGMRPSGSTGELLSISGTHLELGAIYRPHGKPFRMGVVGRLPIEANEVESHPSLVGTPYIPRSVNVPWEVAFSGAYGFGERPLNTMTPPLDRPRVTRRLERERLEREASCVERGMDVASPDPLIPSGCDQFAPRASAPEPTRPRYGLVTAELVVIGRTPDGIGLDGYLSQTVRPWGSRVTVSPRLGVEGEPWRNRMKLRGGLYREPNRSSLATPRTHFTAGFDLRLFDWDIFGLLAERMGFQIAATSDFAREYVSVGVGVGVWH